MKLILSALILLAATPVVASHPRAEKLAPLFDGYKACFILYDLVSKKEVVSYGGVQCAKRMPACSTFKVALAAIGFDSGLLKDESDSFKWNGTKYSIEGWNKDHTTATWMKDSVVWVSQEITPKLGAAKLTQYLKKFHYGTADVSGGLTGAWLTAAPFMEKAPKSTLTISPREQVKFLTALYDSGLSISDRARKLTRNITKLDPLVGFNFYGKTGSGLIGPEKDLRLGWFVSYLEKGDKKYAAVVSIVDSKKKQGASYAGPEAREILKKAITAVLADPAH